MIKKVTVNSREQAMDVINAMKAEGYHLVSSSNNNMPEGIYEFTFSIKDEEELMLRDAVAALET